MCRCRENFLIIDSQSDIPGFLAFLSASLDIGELSDTRIDRIIP